MILRLLRLGGGLLASKTVTVVLMAALAGAGTYVLYVIKDRGALQERIAQEQDNARAWAERFDELQADREWRERMDQELTDSRRARERLARSVDQQIEELRREQPDVEDFLGRRAPGELVRVLCDDGTLAQTAPECSRDP